MKKIYIETLPEDWCEDKQENFYEINENFLIKYFKLKYNYFNILEYKYNTSYIKIKLEEDTILRLKKIGYFSGYIQDDLLYIDRFFLYKKFY